MKKRNITITVCLLALLLWAVPGMTANQQQIMGAGPSTKIAQLFADQFSATPAGNDYKFTVPPKSIKHAGGIKSSAKFIFGRTGRPLTEQEKAQGKDEIFLARIPISIVIGADTGVKKLSLAQLEKIITGQVSNWKEVGGPDAAIVVLGREPNEALFSVLKKEYGFFNNAKFVRTFKKDDQIVAFMASPNGKNAISFGAMPNFEGNSALNIVEVEGMKVGVSLGLVYDQKNSEHQLVTATKGYVVSEDWKAHVVKAGLLPPN